MNLLEPEQYQSRIDSIRNELSRVKRLVKIAVHLEKREYSKRLWDYHFCLTMQINRYSKSRDASLFLDSSERDAVFHRVIKRVLAKTTKEQEKEAKIRKNLEEELNSEMTEQQRQEYAERPELLYSFAIDRIDEHIGERQGKIR
jgi:hypothetical protein